jgi:hypothetical protein
MHFQLCSILKDERDTDVTGEGCEDTRNNRDKAIKEHLGMLKGI